MSSSQSAAASYGSVNHVDNDKRRDTARRRESSFSSRYGYRNLVIPALLVSSFAAMLVLSTSGKLLRGWVEWAGDRREYKVVMIRHGEKPADMRNKHLSATGVMRSERWAKIFSCSDDALGLCDEGFEPTRLVARKAERPRFVEREVETLEPLAILLGIAVEELGVNETEAMAASLRDKAQDAIVCWEHYDMYRVCGQILGGNKKCPKAVREWADDEFSLALILTFEGSEDENGSIELRYDLKTMII